MPYVWTAQVLEHLSGSDKGIMRCHQVTPAVKAEMRQILKDMQGKKVATAKRSSECGRNRNRPGFSGRCCRGVEECPLLDSTTRGPRSPPRSLCLPSPNINPVM